MTQKTIENNGIISSKRPYKKPVLNQVHLVPEEAVLALCKTGGGGLTVRNFCRINGYPTCVRDSTS